MPVGHFDVSFGKMSIQIFSPFFKFVFFFAIELYELLYILDISPLSDTRFAHIFSRLVGCLFILLMVSFAVQKL